MISGYTIALKPTIRSFYVPYSDGLSDVPARVSSWTGRVQLHMGESYGFTRDPNGFERVQRYKLVDGVL